MPETSNYNSKISADIEMLIEKMSIAYQHVITNEQTNILILKPANYTYIYIWLYDFIVLIGNK